MFLLLTEFIPEGLLSEESENDTDEDYWEQLIKSLGSKPFVMSLSSFFVRLFISSELTN